jgi:hypothetical protein
VKNPIRNETSLVLVVAVILSAVAIPVLSGFLEPSQPPAVAAVQIGDPRDRDDGAPGPAREPRTEDTRTAPARYDRRTPSPKRKRPASPSAAASTSSAAPDDLADDDGEAD